MHFEALQTVKVGLRLHDNLMLVRKSLMTVITRPRDLEERDVGRSSSLTHWIQGCHFLDVRAWEGREHCGHYRGGRGCLDKQEVPIEEVSFRSWSPNIVIIIMGSTAF